jgi:membrane protease YdiL (CAAX protease family)
MGKWLRIEVGRYPIFSYFVLAFALSWSVGFLLVAQRYGLVNVPPALHYLTGLGPALAAVLVTGLVSGRSGLKELFSRVTMWKIGWRWILIACASPLLLAGGAVLVQFILTSTLPDLRLLGHVEYLGDMGILAALILWVATFGFCEEIGWRGFALRTMQGRGWGFLPSAGIIGVMWALWHLPAFFYKPTYMGLGVGGFVGFTLGVVSGSVLLAWIYNGTGGSIFAVAIWHALFDFATASPAGEGTVAAVTSTAVIFCAVAIAGVVLWRQFRKPASPAPLEAALQT